MAATSLGATEFIRQLDEAVATRDDESRCLNVKKVLIDAVAGSGLTLPAAYLEPIPERYARRLLHRDPATRPAMAGAARLLTRATAPGVTPVAAVPADDPPAPPRRRRSRLAYAGTALVLTAAAVVAATSIPPGREPTSAAAQLALR